MKEFFNTIELSDAELETVVGGYDIVTASGGEVSGSLYSPNTITIAPGSENGSAPATQQGSSATPQVTSQQQSTQGSSSSPLGALGGLLGGL
ncbi:MAG: hypothetical protein JO125_04670 [Chloroflexi bacterium]|nr:hypothetical protein [Ktedonobacteraceae bacterium]MBV9021685.1 hypothetical protein [Ktedonobacteraceae bacterium]MBV9706681.1 hypothetical protein [Chloroflexota bacterium]